MFNLQQYSAKIAVITDRGEKLTYAELYTKVEDFHEHIPVKGLIFFVRKSAGVFSGIYSMYNEKDSCCIT